MEDSVIALFEFENGKEGISVVSEKHCKLVPADQVTADDLAVYRERVAE